MKSQTTLLGISMSLSDSPLNRRSVNFHSSSFAGPCSSQEIDFDENSTDFDHPQYLHSARKMGTKINSSRNYDIAFSSSLSARNLEQRPLSPEKSDDAGIGREYKISKSLNMEESVRQTLIRRFQEWKKTRRLSGWRFGVPTGFLIAVSVLMLNIILLILSVSQPGGYQSGGIAILARGSSTTISAISAAYHVLLNVLSTLLLGASNYTRQVLCSPTRTDVNCAHENGKSLDIGVFSFRNLRHISRRRLWLWCMLALSSLPLHLM